ncbi:MAG: hypothetical protein WBW33_14775 [Bryobacteraceae bacterium]
MITTNRRVFLSAGLSAGVALAAKQPPEAAVYRFSVGAYEVEMSVEFYDQYAAKGFWFNERRTNSEFCLSRSGEANKNCLNNFHGSMAVAHYRLKDLAGSSLYARRSSTTVEIRERVRTIDQDSNLNPRPPFEQRLQVREGHATDIQAFGYEGESPDPAAGVPIGPWCVLRQDLYFDGNDSPFLVLHWKHSLSAVRLLDLIPGAGTRALA